MQYSSHAESHVPCFQERVGTGHPGYMIPDRLPWRLRARPSATLHEIQVRSEERTCSHDATETRHVTSRAISGRCESKTFNHGGREGSRRKGKPARPCPCLSNSRAQSRASVE